MADLKYGTEEYRKAIEELNRGGFEAADNGDLMAVFAGTKKQVKAAREIAESTGRVENLESAIRLHKESSVCGTKEELAEAEIEPKTRVEFEKIPSFLDMPASPRAKDE